MDDLIHEAARAGARPAIRSARIASAPDARGRVDVTVASVAGARLRERGCPVMPRVTTNASGALVALQPARGDLAWVALDEKGTAVVVYWEPRT
jgi:hypothetical protein